MGREAEAGVRGGALFHPPALSARMPGMHAAPVPRPLAALLLACAASGCASAPIEELPADPQGALDLAQGWVVDRPADARYVLARLDEDALTNEELERYKALYAEALWRTDDAWDGFKLIRNFVEDHRFSTWTPRVEEIHFRIGEELIQSEASYFIFGSDRDDGELVLAEFVERYTTSPHLADALRLLGDLAFEEQRWFDAQRRFEQLLQDHPTSEWAALASFRRVMAIHAELLGPEYDLPSLNRARNELRDYVATAPERPEFRDAAAAAYAEIEDWIAERHLIDAEFYRTVGNRYGERYHLRLLLEDSPAAQPQVAEARRRLEALEAGS
jgi:hypothetical protein